MRLGIDRYSLRWQGWDAFQLLEYCAGLGLNSVQFSGRDYFASLDHDYLRRVKGRADELGLRLELGMGRIDRFASSFHAEEGSAEEQLGMMLRACTVVGSRVVRCYLGGHQERPGETPLTRHIAECVRVLRAVAPLARDLGVRIAVENHGGSICSPARCWS